VKQLRRLTRVLVGLMLLAVLVCAAGFVVVLTAQVDERHEADAIVVLGAAQYNGRPSPVFQARLDHALRLYRERLAPRIVVTGGRARGDAESEAVVGRRYLATQGVPRTALVAEPAGRSTEASISAVARWLRAAQHQSVILVSDPFHMARLRAEARRTGITAYLSPTSTSPISDNAGIELEYLLAEAWKVPLAWLRSLLPWNPEPAGA
jgi:uncharacterized SAM-binding protein YcdF (DUF218 family)